MTDESILCTSTHHSLVVEPWPALPGGIHVAHVDDPDQPILLLRDRDEVIRLVGALYRALNVSERA